MQDVKKHKSKYTT